MFNMDKKQPISPELTPEEQKKAQIEQVEAEIKKVQEEIDSRLAGIESEEAKYGPKKRSDTYLSGYYQEMAELNAKLKKLEGEK